MEHPDMARMQALLQTPEGQNLIRLLQSSCGSVLQQAAQAASTGNYAAAQAILQPMMTGELRSAADRLQTRLD